MTPWQRPWDEPMFETIDYAIGGKLVSVSVRVSDEIMVSQFSDQNARAIMRQKLCEDLASAMLAKNMVEINQQKNIDFTTTIVARAYLAPNDQVKILRTLKK
jgi:hypothetical protein